MVAARACAGAQGCRCCNDYVIIEIKHISTDFQLSGLENVVFNDFIDEELDTEDVSEQRASVSLPDSVPIAASSVGGRACCT